MRKVINTNNKRISLWLILLLFTIKGVSQSKFNLVCNYSFEDSFICPSSSNGDLLPKPWYQPTTVNNQNGAYANGCSLDTTASVPLNSPGYQYARTGQAYAFYVAYRHIPLPNRFLSYIQSPLKDSLKTNKNYYVEFFINSANIGRYGCNNNSMLFTKEPIYADTINDPDGVIPANPQIINFGNPIILDTFNWVKVSSIYKAHGGEKLITIGNFKYDFQTNLDTLPNITYEYAAYYLDDVSVIPLDSFCLQADAGRDTTIKPNDSVFIGSYTNGIDTIKWYNSNGQIIDSVQPGFWVHPATTGVYTYIVEQTVNGCYSKDTIHVNVVLPLRMMNYELRILNEKVVENKWETANEVNVSHYNIQRSTNGKDFATIGNVKANNRSSNEYSFNDQLTSNEKRETLYYKIVGVDKDGSKTYSAIKTLNFKPKTSNVSVYPNPAKDMVNVSSSEKIKEIKLLNTFGQVVYHSNSINNTSYIVHLTSYIKGLYLLQITKANGEVYNEKLIVE